jgi:hypothetical protein
VVRHIFKPARCGYTLRVTSQASYSPEYITPTQKNHECAIFNYQDFWASHSIELTVEGFFRLKFRAKDYNIEFWT